MSRNQDRIEGQYAIVSAYRKGALDNLDKHRTALKWLLARGAIVEQLFGQWEGEHERSIRIHGPKAAMLAHIIATDYKQDAFIVVENGEAVLYSWSSETDKLGFFPSATFTRMVEVDSNVPTADNYSETMDGFAFRFEK